MISKSTREIGHEKRRRREKSQRFLCIRTVRRMRDAQGLEKFDFLLCIFIAAAQSPRFFFYYLKSRVSAVRSILLYVLRTQREGESYRRCRPIEKRTTV